MKPVTDPSILSQLEPGSGAQDRRPVSDPILLQALNREPTAMDTVRDVALEGTGGINRGVDDLLNFIGLPARAAANAFGANIPPARIFSRANIEREPETTAGRYAGAVGEAIGGTVIPAAGLMRAASKLPQVAPLVPSLADRFLRPIAQNPGAATGIDLTAATGAGLAQQGAEEAGAHPGVQGLAAIAGGFAAPVAGIGAMRGLQATGRAAQNRFGIRASADGAMPSPQVQADAAQMIADQMQRAGVTVDDLERRLATGAWSRRLHTSGEAPDVTVLADLDESLARLVGSAARHQPEAANVARRFIAARQTGLEQDAPLHREAGIPTRQEMDKDAIASGQHDRMVEGLKRAFRLWDDRHHGHAANANRTDDQIAAAARAESAPLYEATYRAGEGVNLQPHLAPVIRKWTDIAAADEPEPVQRAINSILRQFAQVTGIKQFDKNKQFLLDAKIDKLFNAIEGRNRYFGGRLTELKNDLLAAVDGIEANGLGTSYRDARSVFSSHAEARRVLQMGRDAFNEEADIGVDAFNALTERGQQKLFRLGYLGAFEKKSAALPHGADRTRLLSSRRQEDILANIIERTETATGRVKIEGGAPAAYSDRPQRFAEFTAGEGRHTRTRDIAKGGSPTAERLADDANFDTLHNIIDIFKDPRLLSIGKRAFEFALNKMFGMPADRSVAIVEQLFTADPVARARVLNNIRMRLGRSRFERLARIMEQQGRSLTGTGGGLAATLAPEGPE